MILNKYFGMLNANETETKRNDELSDLTNTPKKNQQSLSRIRKKLESNALQRRSSIVYFCR